MKLSPSAVRSAAVVAAPAGAVHAPLTDSAGSGTPRSDRTTRKKTSALAGRHCGSLLVAARTSWSTAGGTPPTSALTGGTSELTCAWATASGVSPLYGCRPVSISKSMMPAEYTSVRASVGAPVTCSGAI